MKRTPKKRRAPKQPRDPGIVLPGFLQRALPKPFNSLTVGLALALALDHHGTGAAIRKTAERLHSRSPDHRAKLRRLAQELSDREALGYAVNMTDVLTRALGMQVERPFEYIPDVALVDPPKCHWKSMRLAGAPGARHWRCQHCNHTKPLELPYDLPVQRH